MFRHTGPPVLTTQLKTQLHSFYSVNQQILGIPHLPLFQGASALMALPLLLFERSRDHLVRGSSHAWHYSRVANTSNSNRDAALVDILNTFYVPTFRTYGTLIYFIKKTN